MKIKELATHIIEFIKAKKGYCILAAALIVLVIVALCNLNIETVDQHNARKNDETQKRQELLAELEGSDKASETVSGQSVLTAGGTTETANSPTDVSNSPTGVSNSSIDMGSTDLTASSEEGAASDSFNGQTSGSQSSNTGSTNQLGNQNQSQSISQSQSGNQNQSQSANQSQSGNQNQSQSANQSQSGNQNQSQSANQSQSGNQNQSQSTSQSQSGTSSSPGQEDQYIIVTVKITCDSVIDNPDLTTSANIPSNGIFLETKTAVKSGETVFDALKAVCTDNGMSYTYSGPASSAYITSIGGLNEKECGKYSGWKYKVNGTISGKSCSTYKLSNNDVVQWYYATSVNQ